MTDRKVFIHSIRYGGGLLRVLVHDGVENGGDVTVRPLRRV